LTIRHLWGIKTPSLHKQQRCGFAAAGNYADQAQPDFPMRLFLWSGVIGGFFPAGPAWFPGLQTGHVWPPYLQLMVGLHLKEPRL